MIVAQIIAFICLGALYFVVGLAACAIASDEPWAQGTSPFVWFLICIFWPFVVAAFFILVIIACASWIYHLPARAGRS